MNLSYIGTELRFALAALLIAFILGLLSGYWGLSFSFVFFIYISLQLLQIARLRQWLAEGASIKGTPDLVGAVDKIVDEVCSIKKESARQKDNLEELLRRFDAATRAMPDAMLVVNNNQNIDWANPAAEKLLGIDPQRDIGQRIDNIVRDPEIATYLGNADFSKPLEFSSAQSEENDLMLRVISYGEGRKLLCVHDHQDLLRLQHVRKAFISNASHEMRTPLTVIIGYLEALALRSETDSATRRGIEGALEQAHRLNQLIDDLLSLSRLESLPLIKSQITQVDVAALVRESVDLVKASNIYNEQQFELHLQSDLFIRGDQRELQSAVQNVIDNAVKYSPPKTLIKIKWSTVLDSGPLLTVRDQGEGVESGHLRRLTERFYRVDTGRSRDMGGTGLGLSIVKHVMERHEAEMKIISEVGSGTTVQLHFPADRICHQKQQVNS